MEAHGVHAFTTTSIPRFNQIEPVPSHAGAIHIGRVGKRNMRLQIVTISFASLGTLMCLYSEDVPQQASPAPRPVPARTVSKVPASYEDMHDLFVADFTDEMGFGVSRIPRMFNRPRSVVVGNKSQSITSFELIGIAKHETPVVHRHYEHVKGVRGTAQPAKKPVNANATQQVASPESRETRQLSEFEASALAVFRKGGELVQGFDKNKQDRLIVAPIRATQQCVKCHEGSQEGDMLGAFTYRLTPTPPAPTIESYSGEVPILGR